MIVVQLLGGLGNQMFQYALGKHLAILNNTKLKLDKSFLFNEIKIPNFTKRNFELEIFNIEQNESIFPIYDKKKSIKSIPYRLLHLIKIYLNGYRYLKEFQLSFNKKILTKRGDLYLDGYWQSHKYFESISDIIKKDFSFKKNLPNNLSELKTNIQNHNSVCLHIRRTDYLSDKKLGVNQESYLSKALVYIKENLKDPIIYVFSDDIEWCKKNVTFEKKIHFISNSTLENNTEIDFHLMTLCKNFIIANSSYSWWAAWLSSNQKKIVIAPKNWFLDATITTNDILPDNWIKM